MEPRDRDYWSGRFAWHTVLRRRYAQVTYFGLGTAGEANGTQTLPGTDVGTVQAGCQIGNLATNNVSTSGVFVTTPPTQLRRFSNSGRAVET